MPLRPSILCRRLCHIPLDSCRNRIINSSTIPASRYRNNSTLSDHVPNINPSPRSTVQVGISYEHLCAQTLLRLGFVNITRTGGRSDRGIDLLGHWIPPTLPLDSKGLPVVVQCKAFARKIGPDVVRELEGAVAGAPAEWRGGDTIGMLCAKKQATEGVRQAVRRSERGIMWVMIEDLDDGKEGLEGEAREGRVRQLLWNGRVGKVISDRVGTGLRYLPGERGVEKEVCLALDGKLWEPGVKFQESG